MQKLIILFIIYAFFIMLSLTLGYAAQLVFPVYSNIVTATLLTASAVSSFFIFIFDTGASK